MANLVPLIKDGGALEKLRAFFAEQFAKQSAYKMERDALMTEAFSEKNLPSEAQAAWFGSQTVPGTATVTAYGGMAGYPPREVKLQDLPEYMVEGEKIPSMEEHIEQGGWGYLHAGLQALGVLGDFAMLPPLKIPGAVSRAILGIARRGADKPGKAPKGLASLAQKLKGVHKADIIQFAKDDHGFISPSLKKLIEKAPTNLKGKEISEWLRANAKRKELEFLGAEDFIAANPKATVREVMAGISPNKVSITARVLAEGQPVAGDYNITTPDTDPLDGSNLWEHEIDRINDNLANRYSLIPGIQDDLLRHYNLVQPITGQRKLASFDEIPKPMLEEVIESLAKENYFLNPYKQIEAVGRGPGTFAFGNDDRGYRIFVDGNRVTDPDNIAYSETEAKIKLAEAIGDTFSDPLAASTLEGTNLEPDEDWRWVVDQSLPGGNNYRQIIFDWDNAPVGHGPLIDDHFVNYPNKIAHALVRDRMLEDGSLTLNADEIQADPARTGLAYGYDTPENRALYKGKFDVNEELIQKEIARLIPLLEEGELFFGGQGSTLRHYPSAGKFRFPVEPERISNTIQKLQWYIDPGLATGAPDWLSQHNIKAEIARRMGTQLSVEDFNVIEDYADSGEGELARLFKGQIEILEDQGKLVPNWPHKDDWHKMVIKKLLLYAIDQGIDNLSISGSAPIINRYSERYKKMYTMLYDKKIPSAMEKIANDYGGKFEVTQLDIDDTFTPATPIKPEFSNPENLKVHVIRITPEMKANMKAKILEDGIPSFAKGGEVNTVGIGLLPRARRLEHAVFL